MVVFRSLYILCMVSFVNCLQIFSSSLSYILKVFCRAKILNFGKVQYIYFFLWIMFLVALSKNCQIQVYRKFSPLISFRNLLFDISIYRPFWVNFCITLRFSPPSPLVYGCPSVPTLLIEKAAIPALNCICTWVGN